MLAAGFIKSSLWSFSAIFGFAILASQLRKIAQ